MMRETLQPPEPSSSRPGNPGGRDARVDLLRGLSLLSIFVDHIPGNRLAEATLHNFGFSDAAELFVILSGFSAEIAYGRVFSRDGVRSGLLKVALRCLKIYGTQVALLIATLIAARLFAHALGPDEIVGPLLRDGVRGLVRGLTLLALPTYLDILPLYIVLLGVFPLIHFALRRSPGLTLGASLLLYTAANALHWNLPNVVDPGARTHWYFNPLAWQLVFVLGAAIAIEMRAGGTLLRDPPALLRAASWAYLVFAFVATDAWDLWPRPFGHDFPGTAAPFAIFGNEPKSFVTPWRLLHVLAIVYLALTSEGLRRFAERPGVDAIVACGRHSLEIFALGCLLALGGRLIFRVAEVTLWTQIVVNGIGIAGLLGAGLLLDRLRKGLSGLRRAPCQAHSVMSPQDAVLPGRSEPAVSPSQPSSR